MLTQTEFEALCYFHSHSQPYHSSQAPGDFHSLSTALALPSTEAVKTAETCRAAGWLSPDGRITPAGYDALAPYRVSHAVIMAAGMSSRFAPLCYETPKGLLQVKGEILIERQIRQLLEAGIKDITLVVGYMKEKFFYLREKFGVDIVVNEDYYRYNNTSTLMLVLDKIREGAYICSSDDYFEENVFTPYVYQAYYAAVHTDSETEEYCLTTSPSGRITGVSIGGGPDAWYMLGHVYFSRDFAARFIPILEREYEENPVTKEELWENLYMRHLDKLELYIKKYDARQIKEFDSLEELRRFDPHYIEHTGSAIMGNICKTLHCKEKDIIEIAAIKDGLTNSSFRFACKGKKYVYRHPGVGTESYIHRDSEAFSMEVAHKLGLDDTFIYMEPEEGWKLSYYIEDAHTLNYHDEKEVRQAVSMIRSLHDADIKSRYDFDIWRATLDFIQRLSEKDKNSFPDFDALYQKMEELYQNTESDGIPKRLCHCDCYDPNFLVGKDGKMSLIDWEYSGNDDPANDLGTFICCSDYTYDEALGIFQLYFGRPLDKKELRHFTGYVAIASYYWFVWAIFQESVGNTVGEYLNIWYQGAKFYSQKSLELYHQN